MVRRAVKAISNLFANRRPPPPPGLRFQNIFVGLVVGSLFSRLNVNNFQTTLGFMFFCMLFLSFGGTTPASLWLRLAVLVVQAVLQNL